MRPILFTLPIPGYGEAPIHSYGVMLTISFLVGIWFAMRLAERDGIDPDRFLAAGLLGWVGAIVGSRLLHVIAEEPRRYFHHPEDILKLWQGGLVFYGGFLGGVGGVTVYLLRKRIPLGKFWDACAPFIALGHFFTRIGCFLNGCCYGMRTSLPWGVTYPQGSEVYQDHLAFGWIAPTAPRSLPVHPVPLYESLEGLLLFAFLYWRVYPRKRWDGEVFWYYAVLYAVLRFLNEMIRADDIRGFLLPLSRFPALLTTSQGIALAVLALAIPYRIWWVKLPEAPGEHPVSGEKL